MTQYSNLPDNSGDPAIQRLIHGQGDLHDIDSPDYDSFVHMVRSTSTEELASIFAESADRIDPNAVREDILSGDTGNRPFNRTDIAKMARELYTGMVNCHGLSFDPANLFRQVPGLQHIDPEVMTAEDVAILAEWMRRNDPAAFGEAAADLSQREPGLLPHLLGERALQYAAASLAERFRGRAS